MKTYYRKRLWGKTIDAVNNVRNNKESIFIVNNQSEKSKYQKLYPDIKEQIKMIDEITVSCAGCGKKMKYKDIHFKNKCKPCVIKEEIEKTKKNHEDIINQLDSKDITDSIKGGVEKTIEHEEQYQKEFKKRFIDNHKR